MFCLARTMRRIVSWRAKRTDPGLFSPEPRRGRGAGRRPDPRTGCCPASRYRRRAGRDRSAGTPRSAGVATRLAMAPPDVGADDAVAALVTERDDFLPELPGVGAALGPAFVEVGLVLVQRGGSVELILTGEEIFRPGGIGKAFDGAVRHVELAADGAAAVAGFQHRVDRGVSGPDAVGEPVALPGRGGVHHGGCRLGGSLLDRHLPAGFDRRWRCPTRP